MKPTKKDIEEIAELPDTGMVCFFHIPAGATEYYADPDDNMEIDDDAWQETAEKVEADWENYMKFRRMDSRRGYQVMEDFAYAMEDHKFRDQRLDQLSRPKPFSRFKWTVDNSDYRQEWFAFKKQASIDWVNEQLENQPG